MRPDDSRWAALWPHRADLLRVARRRTCCHADAEDAVSEAMLRAALHPDLDEARAGSFLTTVTVRLCADLHRDRARAARASAAWGADDRLVTTPETVVCDRAEAAWYAGVAARALSPTEHAALRARVAGERCASKSASAAFSRARAKVLRHT